MKRKEFREMLKEVAVEYSEHLMYCYETSVEPDNFQTYLFRGMTIDKEEKSWSPDTLIRDDRYWYINDMGDVATDQWNNTDWDIFRRKKKNVFETSEYADMALDKILNS